MAQNILVFSIVAMLVISVGVSAKRGCSAFGHSCFGGHGKRSGDPTGVDASNSEVVMMSRHPVGQEETAPHPVYPHSGYALLPTGDDMIPVRDGGAYDRDENGVRDVMKMKLQNMLKHWMDSYRRSQQNEDSYFIETL